MIPITFNVSLTRISIFHLFFFSFVTVKRVFAFILTLLYLSIATGFNTYSHYCMDRYVGTSFWQKESTTCSVCGMDKSKTSTKKHCCKEEHKQIKLEKDHQASDYVMQSFQTPFVAVLPSLLTWEAPNIQQTVSQEYPVNHGPPGKEYHSLHILHCTYLI